MKKLLLLFSLILTVACSSDDAPTNTNPPASNTVEILSHDYEMYESTTIGKRFKFTAIVKNNTQASVNGKVKFDIAHDNGGTGYIYINDVSLEAGETKTVFVMGSTYFQTQTLNIAAVAFISE